MSGKDILVAVIVIVIINFSGVLWYYLKRMVTKPDVQTLMNNKDISGLIRALKYKNKQYDFNNIRFNAAIALGNVGDLKAIDKLLSALNDCDRRIPEAAIQAIGQIIWRWIREPLFQAHGRNDKISVNSFLQQLQQYQIKTAFPIIQAYPKMEKKAIAINALGAIAGSGAADFLWNLIRNEGDTNIRHQAAQAFIRTGDPRHTNLLLQLVNDRDAELRSYALNILEKVNISGLTELLIPKLKDPDWQLRSFAVNNLSKRKDPRNFVLFCEALQDKSGMVRKAAIDALKNSGNPDAVQYLHPLLVDSSSECREAAVSALSLLGEKQWGQWVQGDQQDFIRLASSGESLAWELLGHALENDEVITALAEAGDKRAVKPLINKLSDSYSGLRKDAARLLGKIRDPLAVQSLIHLLKKDKDFGVLETAAEALGRIGDASAGEALLSAMAHPAPEVSSAASDALSTIGGPVAIKCLLKGMSSENSDIQKLSFETLQRMPWDRLKPDLHEAKNDIDFSILIHALGNRDPKARQFIVKILNELEIDQWSQWIKGDDQDFNRLAFSGEPQAFDILIHSMNSELAILALAKTGDKRAVKPLLANLENTNVKIVEATMKALGILKDAKAVEPLRLKLNIHEPLVRKAAAEALSELGETQWQSCVKGEERDTVRLAEKGLPAAIQALIAELSSPNWGLRKAAAGSLIKIASKPPDGFRNFWNEIQTLINEPHTDSHHDEYRSTDCSYSEHTDRGIGLSAPKFLKGK